MIFKSNIKLYNNNSSNCIVSKVLAIWIVHCGEYPVDGAFAKQNAPSSNCQTKKALILKFGSQEVQLTRRRSEFDRPAANFGLCVSEKVSCESEHTVKVGLSAEVPAAAVSRLSNRKLEPLLAGG